MFHRTPLVPTDLPPLLPNSHGRYFDTYNDVPGSLPIMCSRPQALARVHPSGLATPEATAGTKEAGGWALRPAAVGTVDTHAT